MASGDLPDRFPSVLSRDFRKEQGQYEDADNLYAMYLLYNLARYAVNLDPATRRVVIARSKEPLPYAQAAQMATESAAADSRRYAAKQIFRPDGTRIGEEPIDASGR